MAEGQVVLDTSVLYPALFLPGSAARRALREVVRVCWPILMTHELITECVDVMRKGGRSSSVLRPRFESLQSIEGKVRWIDALPLEPGRYPTSLKDYHVIAAAEAARGLDSDPSTWILSENAKDFTIARIAEKLAKSGITALRAGDAADRLRSLPDRVDPARIDRLFPDED